MINVAGVKIHKKDEEGAYRSLGFALDKQALIEAERIVRDRLPPGGYGINDIDKKIEAVADWLIDNFHLINERA